MIYKEKTVPLKDGRTAVLRSPHPTEDAAALIDFMKVTGAETPYLMYEVGEFSFTVEQEKAFLQKFVDSESDLMLIAEVDGQIAGNCEFKGKTKQRARHRCDFAIALYQAYCSLGIGTALLTALLDEAKRCGYEQAELDVIAGNERAIGLYKKLGFEICGTRPHDLKYADGTYADAHMMVKEL